MKKYLALWLSVMLLAAWCAVATAADEDWNFDADYYFIRGYNGTDANVVMPSWLRDCPVEVLESGVLRDRQELQTVILSDNLLDLRYCNFYSNENLTSVTLPDSLIVIGDSNFFQCDAITTVTVPSRVSYVGADCFCLCDSLTTVIFEGVCPVFGPRCFQDNALPVTILVPDDQLEAYRAALPGQNVQPSGKASEEQDFSAETWWYTVEDGTVIAYEGFETRVDIPASIEGEAITAIGDYAFPESHYITLVSVPEGVTSIGSFAFSDMQQLVHVSLPSTLTTIGDNAFEGFRGYAIDIPDGVTTIGANAFLGSRLTGTLVLPASLTSLSPDFLIGNVGVDKLVIMGNPLALPPELPDYYPFVEIALPEDATELQQKQLEAYLYGVPALTIAVQPADAAALAGEPATTEVEVVGDGLTYAWYLRRANDKRFTLMEGAADSRLSITMDEAAHGSQAYCVVTDMYGSTVESELMTFRLEAKPVEDPVEAPANEPVEAPADAPVEAPEEEPSEMPAPSPVGEAGKPYLGTWKLQSLLLEGVSLDPSVLGMVMDMTFYEDGTAASYDGETHETGVWTVSDGVAMVMEMILTITDDGRLCMTEGDSSMYFVRSEGTSAPEASGDAAPSGFTSYEDYLEKKFLCTTYTTFGMTMDAETLGAAYSLLFHANGTCEFIMAGVAMPGASWALADVAVGLEQRKAFSINYYGMMYHAVPTATGFDMDYFGTMTLHFVPAE